MDAKVLSISARTASSSSQRSLEGQGRSRVARFWIYQQERFPILGHGVLIGAFSCSAVSFSWLLRGAASLPSLTAFAVAFLSCFFFFFQLRVADEFKDFDEDARWRPYRPVPRGLVGLRELAALAATAGLAQLALAWAISWRLTLLLLLVWIYLALMTKEFFVRDWLLARPLTYLWTHMLIIPMADFYATACDWTGTEGKPPAGLFWFLAVSFCNGVTLELGRKIRAPESEEEGVRTYSALWGPSRATLVWLGALLMTAFSAGMAAAQISFLRPVALVLGACVLIGIGLAQRFAGQPTVRGAKALEQFSGLWTVTMYLMLGAIPLCLRWGKVLP